MSVRAMVWGTVAAMAAAAVPLFAAPASAGPATDYCYTTLLSDTALQAGATNTISCFRTERELAKAVATDLSVGATAVPSAAVPSAFGADISVRALSFSYRRLARHYDSSSGTGSNLSVYGTSCNGGGLNLAGTGWEDRISSTMHGACGTIVHYSASGFGGLSDLTVGACGVVVALDYLLDNVVSSIRYFAPESGGCAI